MLVAIFALSGGLMLLKARAGQTGPVLSLEFTMRPGDRGPVCSTETDRERDVCSFGISGLPGHIWGSVHFLKREGERVKLAIKTVYHAPPAERHEQNEETADLALRNVSPVEYWLEPDKPLSVPVEGLGNILVSGEFQGREPVAPRPQSFNYNMLGRDGQWIMGERVPTNPKGNKYYGREAGMPYVDGAVYVHVRVVERIGETEKIAIRALWIPTGERSADDFQKMHSTPEREFVYSPGDELKIPVDGYGNLAIRGHFESTLPDTVPTGLYPGDGFLRVDPPVVLVRGKEMLGKFDGPGGGQVLVDEFYFAYGEQDEGWFVFSAKRFAGAVEGTLKMNQIEFTLGSQPYILLTGDPMLFESAKIWVRHCVSIRDADPTSQGDGWQGNEPRLAFGELQNLAVEK